jgi:hypothetical protein
MLSVAAWLLTQAVAWLRRTFGSAREAKEVERVLTQLDLSSREFVAR